MKYKCGDVVINKLNNKLANINATYSPNNAEIEYLNTDGFIFDYDTVNLKDVKKVKPFEVSFKIIEKYLKLEIETKDFVPEGNTVFNCKIVGQFKNQPKLLLESIKAICDKKIMADRYVNWYMFVSRNSEQIFGIEDDDFDVAYDQKTVMYYIDRELSSADDLYATLDLPNENEEIDPKVFEESIKTLTYFIEDRKLPISKKRITDEFARYIVDYYNEDSINEAPKSTQELFKRCINLLCDKDDPYAIQKKGYCIYCNSKVFPEDWKACAALFEKHYELTGNPFTANTLGYIYYYGRANKGIPEYDKAFKYFSIGNAAQIYESTYKLADCFKNGYGTIKNDDIAFNLYSSVEHDTRKQMLCQQYNTKFADAALRMAICYEKGIGVTKNEREAYYWYLQAEYAIKKRMEVTHYYGDSKVARGINESISEIRNNYKGYEKQLWQYHSLPLFDQLMSLKSIKIHANVKRNKNGSIKLIVYLTKSPDGEFRNIFLSIPEFDYCGFLEKLTYVTDQKSKITVNGKIKDYFIFNAYHVDRNKETIYFTLDGNVVASIKTNKIYVKNFNQLHPSLSKKEMYVEFHKMLERSIKGEGILQYDRTEFWKEETALFTKDIKTTIDFINTEIEDEEFVYLGEIFSDIVEKTNSKEFVDAIKRRFKKVNKDVDITGTDTDISDAESFLTD